MFCAESALTTGTAAGQWMNPVVALCPCLQCLQWECLQFHPLMKKMAHLEPPYSFCSCHPIYSSREAKAACATSQVSCCVEWPHGNLLVCFHRCGNQVVVLLIQKARLKDGTHCLRHLSTLCVCVGVGGVVQSANNRGLPYSATYSAAGVLLPPHHTKQPLPQRAARVGT